MGKVVRLCTGIFLVMLAFAWLAPAAPALEEKEGRKDDGRKEEKLKEKIKERLSRMPEERREAILKRIKEMSPEERKGFFKKMLAEGKDGGKMDDRRRGGDRGPKRMRDGKHRKGRGPDGMRGRDGRRGGPRGMRGRDGRGERGFGPGRRGEGRRRMGPRRGDRREEIMRRIRNMPPEQRREAVRRFMQGVDRRDGNRRDGRRPGMRRDFGERRGPPPMRGEGFGPRRGPGMREGFGERRGPPPMRGRGFGR